MSHTQRGPRAQMPTIPECLCGKPIPFTWLAPKTNREYAGSKRPKRAFMSGSQSGFHLQRSDTATNIACLMARQSVFLSAAARETSWVGRLHVRCNPNYLDEVEKTNGMIKKHTPQRTEQRQQSALSESGPTIFPPAWHRDCSQIPVAMAFEFSPEF